MKRVKRTRITKGERMLYTFAALCFVSVVGLKVFCNAGISGISMNVELIKKDITEQEKKNESLTMKVSELTSFENIKDVVADMGLAYNNENIIVIND